jgi:hypothetical protein
MEGGSMDLQEVVKRAIKYVVEGLGVAVAMYLIGKNKFAMEEILLVALTAAALFAILDLMSPSISYAARQGAGFGLGANLVGFPNMGGNAVAAAAL